ncbi:MAG TPA: winged helix-turn-helix domain-containing protein [Thermoanaerobaculia bacterium]
MNPERPIRFDEFQLDRETLELRRGNTPVKLQQQPARVLAMLTERAGDLVTREQLRQAIWGDETFVDFDRGLNYCISQIRTALGDTAEAPRYIETLRGRGYRFTGNVRAKESAGTKRPLYLAVAIASVIAVAAVFALTHRPMTPSIGVASFESSPGDAQWAKGFRTQLLNGLSSTATLPVIDLQSQSSARTPWRVEGRVDRSAVQVRVTVVLRDTHDGAVRWSDAYSSAPGDWIDAQDSMADNATRAIRYFAKDPRAGQPMRHKMRRGAPIGYPITPSPSAGQSAPAGASRPPDKRP